MKESPNRTTPFKPTTQSQGGKAIKPGQTYPLR